MSLPVTKRENLTDQVGGPSPGSSDLPGLGERPDGIVVIYDGNCQFCQSQVRRLNWFDHSNKLAFVSLHDPIVAERYPDLSYDQLMEQMYVIDEVGNRFGGAAAFRYLTRRLPKLWMLAPLLHIPFSLPCWQWCYRRIAARRYRWNTNSDVCDQSACEIHMKK